VGLLTGDRDGGTPPAAPGADPLRRSFRRWPVWAQGAVWITATLFVVEALEPAGGGPAGGVAAEASPTTVTAPTTTLADPTTTLAQPTTTLAEPVTGAAAPSTTIAPPSSDWGATPEAAAPAPPGGPTAAPPAGIDSAVTAHVDGDTLEVATGETIRLIGVDTPETKHPSKPVECYGPEASAYTADRFPVGTRVRLVHDVERSDRYGRTLAYVYRADDGLFLNLALVRDGFAQVATYPPNVAHVEELVAAQREAREAGRGLWGAVCATSVPASAPQAAPGTTAYRSCAEAREAGAAPVLRDDPRYGSHLDGDGDGIGCE
jgi:micrococcal nuclease